MGRDRSGPFGGRVILFSPDTILPSDLHSLALSMTALSVCPTAADVGGKRRSPLAPLESLSQYSGVGAARVPSHDHRL